MITMNSQDATRYYVKFPKITSGPFTINQLQKLVARGRLRATTLVSGDGKQWHEACSFEFLDFTNSEPVETLGNQTAFCPECRSPIDMMASACARCGCDFAHDEGDNPEPLDDFVNELIEASGKQGRFFRVLYITSALSGAALCVAAVVMVVVQSAQEGNAPRLSKLMFLPITAFCTGVIGSASLFMTLAPNRIWELPLGEKWRKVVGTKNLLVARTICGFISLLIVGIIAGFAYLLWQGE